MKWIHCDINKICDSEYSQALLELTVSRRKRIERLTRSDDIKRTLAGEILAKKLLSKEYGIKNPQITVTVSGKSQAEGAPHFSIAHCQNIVVCAADKSELGIDIEKIRTVKYSLIKRVCVDDELEYVMGTAAIGENFCNSSDILTRFFEIWTAKEAYFKKIGTGITDFKSVNTCTLKKQFFILDDYMICIVF